jgi:hypothetical protein
MSDPASSRQVNPVLLYVLGGVAVLALGFFLLNNLGGGGKPVGLPASTPFVTGGGGTGGVTGTPAPTAEPTEVFEIFEGRDPFKPLVFESAASGASPAPGSSPAASTAPSGVSATPRPPRSGVQVELLSVASDGGSATVRVGSNVHEGVRPGQTIESGVVMDSIEGRCARFHRGSDSFRLCEGEQVLK